MYGSQFVAMGFIPKLCEKFEKRAVYNVSTVIGVIPFTAIFVMYLIDGTGLYKTHWLIFTAIMFALAGIAWATINVNSFPMVVEMCSGSDVGKYTGFYYTASMAAQALTPMLSGWLMEQRGMTVLFPYAAFFAGLAFVTMLLVKHGDAKPEAKKGLEALDIDD